MEEAPNIFTTENGSRPFRGGGTILLADGDRDSRALFGRTLRAEGYSVVEAEDGVEVIGYFVSSLIALGTLRAFDMLLAGTQIPGMSGLAALAALKEIGAQLPVVLITSPADGAIRAQALRLGAAAVLEKPFRLDSLRKTVADVSARSASAQATGDVVAC